MSVRKFPLFCQLALICLLAASLLAQTFTGTILGTVTDATGATIPNAAVAITNTATNQRTEVQTNDAGAYTVPQLSPGRYTVEITGAGFRKFVRSGITLQVQQQARVDAQMPVGDLTETVTVTSDAALVESTTSVVGKNVDNRRIVDLPLNTRNVYSLIYLTPGVTGGIGNNYNSMSYSVNGARTSMMETIVDGVTASFPTVQGYSGIGAFPSVDAIAEFKVMGSNYQAEFGRSMGSVLNVVFKSGANAFHGSLYEFMRNSALDANNFFDNTRGSRLASFKRSQFGSTVNGPIRRDKTFFLLAYEGLRQNAFANRTFNVPTLLERQGDFSQTRSANGQQVTIYNPFTTRLNPNGGGYIRDAFANNVIPQNLINPVARNVLQYYPLPNTPGNVLTNANNYSQSGSTQLAINQGDVRIDHNLTETQRIFGRYSQRQTEDIPQISFPQEIAIAEGRVIQENFAKNGVLDYSNTLNATTIVTANLGFTRSLYVYNNQGLGFTPSTLGLPSYIDQAVDRFMFPRFGASGYVDLGGNDHRRSAFMSYAAVASITKIAGSHTFKAGFDGRMIRVNVGEANASGTFSFGQGFTQGPNPATASATAGNGIASLLLGTGSGSLVRAFKNVASQSFYYAGYIQDDWRVSRKLTLNLGLRYDIDTPRTERFDRMNYFDPTVRSPLASTVPGLPNLTGGLVFVGVDGRPRTQYFTDKNNFAPRLGFAYELNAKTVIRGAYGNVYGISLQQAHGTVGPFGFRGEDLWVGSLDGFTPANLLSNPYPQAFAPLLGSSRGLLTQVGGPVQGPLQDTLTPWAMQWNFTVQRELPFQMLVEAAYVGTRGLQLMRNGEGGLNLNQLRPEYLALGDGLRTQVTNPFFGTPAGIGILATPTIARSQLLRPYPQFGDVTPLYSSGASSNYHSLQTTFKKRFSQGLLFEGSYTWAKNIDDQMNHQDSYYIKGDRSLATEDVAHRFIISYIYELPFGRGRLLGSNVNRWVDLALGGWQVNGITTFQSGTPLQLTASNTAGIYNNRTYPNSNGNNPQKTGRAQDRLNAWFDTSVFSQPAAYTLGNTTLTSPQLRRDAVRNFDLSLFKDFRILERARVQFRAEALNAFNTPRFGSPDTNVTSRNIGIVSSQDNAPRQIQFGLKLLW